MTTSLTDPILVTGGTGRVGGAVLRELDAHGVPTRALVRDPARAAALPAGEPVVGDLADPSSLDDALAGVAAVLLVFPTLQADEAAPELVRTLGKHTDHVVLLSSAGAGEATPGDGGILGSHARVESLVRDTVPRWTFLRPGGFAANTLGWADQVRSGDTLRWFHGQARRSLIHERDIAAVGALALTAPGHDGLAHHLTGPAGLTQVEQLAEIGAALGRELRFEELTPERAKAELFPGAPAGLADAIVDGHASMVRHPEPVTSTVERLLGRPALSFRQWAADHVDDFR